jgi:hypothetical protein
MEEEMGLKRKQIVMRQKATFEQELKDRLSLLSGKGVKSPQVDKDALVKKLKADIKASNRRLRRIAENEKRTEEMAKIKAERAAAPKKEQEGAKIEKPKGAPQEGKAKKPKAPDGAKGQKKAESSGEPKAKPAKKAEVIKEEPTTPAPAKAEK